MKETCIHQLRRTSKLGIPTPAVMTQQQTCSLVYKGLNNLSACNIDKIFDTKVNEREFHSSTAKNFVPCQIKIVIGECIFNIMDIDNG